MEITHGPDNIQLDGLMHVFNPPSAYLPYPTLSELKWYHYMALGS